MASPIIDAIEPGIEGWTLPTVVSRETKYTVGAMMFGLATLLYLASNRYHFIEPRMLPMSWVDFAVPFVPKSVWIYASESMLFTVVYITCKNISNLNKYIYSFLTLQAVSVLIFWFWPTTYPRDQFPLPVDLDALTFYLFDSLRHADTPANCCPSLHVSSCYLSSFIFLDEQRGKFLFFFLWATAVAVSTLTTKQHYLIDVVTGFLMAVVMYWIFHRQVNYRDTLQANR